MLERFKLSPEPDAADSTTLLGDWYVNLLNVGRARWVLAASERTLLAALVPARAAEFPSVLPRAVERVLASLEIDSEAIEREVSCMGQVVFSRTANRRVLGVLNDYGFAARDHLAAGAPPEVVALRLSETPLSPLSYGYPVDVTRELFRSGVDR